MTVEGATAAYVHDRRCGDRQEVVRTGDPGLSRHERDDLYGATLEPAITTGVCVLTWRPTPAAIETGFYRRLGADLGTTGVAVIGGFVFTSLLSVFVLQSGINGSHQSTLGQALADEIAQQVNIKETQLIDQLAKIASSALATNTITGSITDLSANFPTSAATPEIHVAVKDSEKFSLIETVVETANFEEVTLTTIDGLRVDFADGWGLVKASNTEPALTLRFEADLNESLENIKSAFRELFQEAKSDLNFE